MRVISFLVQVTLWAPLLAVPLVPVPLLLPTFSQLNTTQSNHPDIVPNEYLVVLQEGVACGLSHLNHVLQGVEELFPNALLHLSSFNIGARGAGTGKFHGYSIRITHSSQLVLNAIRHMRGIRYIEHNSIVRTLSPEFQTTQTELSAPWGLARLSHREKLSFSTFNKYQYNSVGGTGVDVYVIDTGVNIGHKDLEGRASWGKTIPANTADVDDNGHGSHVAGTIASKTYGVSKSANIIAVKVLGAGGSGTMADVVAGVSWAADAAYKKRQLRSTSHKGSVANMSLGGGKSPALDAAVNAAVDDGLHFVVAAGNDNKDACDYSPAAAKNAITVGASTISDARAYFSNWGTCVDVFAPGLNILSIWNSGNTAVNTISGTSMASPHVAGLVAYFLSLDRKNFDIGPKSIMEPWWYRWRNWFGRDGDSEISPKNMKKALIEIATSGALTGDLGNGSPNRLIYNNYTEGKLI